MPGLRQGEANFRRDVERHAMDVQRSINDCILRLDNHGVINVKDYGAKGDGVTDDTTAIQAAIDSVSDTGGTVVVPDGVFMIDPDHNNGQSVRLANNVTLHLRRGAVLRAIANDLGVSSVVYGIGLDGIGVVGEGTIDGNRDAHIGASGESGMCILLYGCSNVVLRDVTCINGWGDGVYLGINGSTPCSNVTMSGVTCDGNRRNGCSVVALHEGVISGCQFLNTSGTAPQAGIDVEPDVSGAVDGVTVSDCISADNAGAGMVLTQSSKNCRIHHNYIARCDGNGITVAATGGNNAVDGNTIVDLSASVRGAIDVSSPAAGCLITKNNLRFIETGNAAIYVHSTATDVTVSHNHVSSVSMTAVPAYGILVFAPQTVVDGNYCEDIGSIGIATDAGANRCHVSNNIVLRSVGRGLYLGGTNVTAIGNTAIDVATASPCMIQFPSANAVAIGNRAILTTTDAAITAFAFASTPAFRIGNIAVGTATYTETLPKALVPYMSTSGVLINATNAAGDVTGASQYGLISWLTSGSDAVDNGIGIYARARTAAASFTQALTACLYADTITAGAGSTITEAIGVFAEAQTVGGTNWAIKTGTGGDVSFNGDVHIATPGNYADDTAAASGGVAVGQVYRNGSVLMIRVA